MDNENARKKREEEEKIAKQHQEVSFLILIVLCIMIPWLFEIESFHVAK